MQKIQDVFNRVQVTKRESKNLQQQYKDALEASREYKEITEKLREYKVKKLQIENGVKAELGSQYQKLEGLKKDLELDKELLTDIALSTLMKGETVSVEDADKNVYEPIFSVKFKKTAVVDKKIE
jgi:SMC interacting uncharacterized protein involved in chromosome segregation